jgi:hypothetical protein
VRADAAGEYARRVTDSGGVLVQQVARVGRRFGVKIDPASAREITLLLAEEGVGIDPALSAVTDRDFVELYAVEREPVREPRETPSERRVTLDAATRAAETGVGATAVVVGAAVTAGSFVLIGFVGYWIYGLVYLLLGALGLWLYRFRLAWLARLFLPRFRWLRFNWIFGVLPMLSAALLVSFFFVAPIAAERGAQARERDVTGELALAREAIADGDLRAARRHVDRANARDSTVDGIDAMEAKLHRAVASAEEERRNRRRYEGAIQDFEGEDYLTAISNLEALGNYRDSATLAEQYRSAASRHYLSMARRAYGVDGPKRAIAVAEEAHRFKPTPGTRTFLRDARAQVVAIRVERKRQRRLAAQWRREQREYERQLRAQQRDQEELERQRELEAPPADTGGGGGMGEPCDNGWTVNWCGASRDGDSDGCWCEE